MPPMFVSTVPTAIGVGAEGGGRLAGEYRPVTAVTVQVCVPGAFTLICSPNCPLVSVVALFRHTQGSEMAAEQLKVVMLTVPVMDAVQPP